MFRAAALVASVILSACNPGTSTVTAQDGGEVDVGNGSACVPGQQIHCGCQNGTGVQVCNAAGSAYGPCACESAEPDAGTVVPPPADTGPSEPVDLPPTPDPCENHCVNGVADCGELAIDCGGECGECIYREEDCLAGSPRAGSEICDDEAWTVPADAANLVLVCLNDNGGVVYIANNTGPMMSDGVERCQGWEENGQNAWDHLDYVYQLTCDAEQKFIDVDLSARVGERVYVGAHWDPATYQSNGGHMTWACVTDRK